MHLACVLCIFNAFLLFFFSFLGQLIGILDVLLRNNTHLTRALFLLSRRLVWKAAKLSSTFETRRRRRRTLNDEFFQ
jgi:hypothetical protein